MLCLDFQGNSNGDGNYLAIFVEAEYCLNSSGNVATIYSISTFPSAPDPGLKEAEHIPDVSSSLQSATIYGYDCIGYWKPLSRMLSIFMSKQEKPLSECCIWLGVEVIILSCFSTRVIQDAVLQHAIQERGGSAPRWNDHALYSPSLQLESAWSDP